MHSKRNHKQNEKTAYRMGENIGKWNSWQGINLQNIQIAHRAQYKKKIKQPNQKIGRRPKETISPKKIYRWPKSTWKNAQYHKWLEKSSQNYNEISSHSGQKGQTIDK